MKHVHRISAASRRPSDYISPTPTQAAEMERCNRNRTRCCGAAAAARRSESGCYVVAVLLRRGRAADRGNHGNGYGNTDRCGQLGRGRINARKRSRTA